MHKPYRSLAFHGAGISILALLGSLACGSGDSRLKSCVEDSECPTGEGCYRGSSWGYCSPLCTVDAQCDDQIACPSDQSVPDTAICREAGLHKGQGVCDVYRGAFGPDNCDLGHTACFDGSSWCGCEYGPPDEQGSVGTCRASEFEFGGCCADPTWPAGGRCECERFVCSTAFGECECSPYEVGTATASCPANLPGTACCLDVDPEVGIIGCNCRASNLNGCSFGAPVANCSVDAYACADREVLLDSCL